MAKGIQKESDLFGNPTSFLAKVRFGFKPNLLGLGPPVSVPNRTYRVWGHLVRFQTEPTGSGAIPVRFQTELLRSVVEKFVFRTPQTRKFVVRLRVLF